MAGTTRSTPGGIMLGDGYSTKIAFSSDPDIEFWERTVKPPGIDGGDPVDRTTMHNLTWRTMASRALRTLTNSSVTAGYDPKVFDSIVAIINVEQEITVHFPDGSILIFYGYLKSFEPNEHSEGALPEATIEIVPTNTNPTTGAESSPDYRSSSTATP